MIEFAKAHGLGNDFIILSSDHVNAEEAKKIAERYCDRRFGIGADSVLFTHQSGNADIGMRIFERDGTESDMCGNGLRCIAEGYMLPEEDEVEIETKSGIKTVRRKKGEYEVEIGKVGVNGDGPIYHADVGEPHRVKVVDHIGVKDELFIHEARGIQRSESVNVNFMMEDEDDPQNIHVRTYERGVEDETLACGTGIVACAAVHHRNNDYSRIPVKARGGTAIVRVKGGSYYLQGPAEVVYMGHIENDWL